MLQPVDTRQDFLRERLAWMAIARGELGVTTKPGAQTNPRIEEYQRFNPELFQKIVKGGFYNGDETAWCSAFVNWVFKECGYSRTHHWGARSWLNWGRASEQRYGAVAILSRGPAPAGHVGFFVREEGSSLVLLGGNQKRIHAVCESHYPKSRLLGYRWPMERELDAVRPPLHSLS